MSLSKPIIPIDDTDDTDDTNDNELTPINSDNESDTTLTNMNNEKTNNDNSQEEYEKELLNEALEIMMNQVSISRDHAIRFIKENNYDPVAAILAFMGYKSENETNHCLTTMINPYELINELVTLSDSLKFKKYRPEEYEISTIQTYVCILINDSGLRKFKKYTNISNLSKLYVSSTNTYLLKFKIGVEYYGILYSEDNITTEPKTINKELSVILRNFELIGKEQFYSGNALFINNCFLN